MRIISQARFSYNPTFFTGKVELAGNHRLHFGKTCFRVYDEEDREIYYEGADGFWSKSKYDEQSNKSRYEDSTGHNWMKVYANGELGYFEENGKVVVGR